MTLSRTHSSGNGWMNGWRCHIIITAMDVKSHHWSLEPRAYSSVAFGSIQLELDIQITSSPALRNQLYLNNALNFFLLSGFPVAETNMAKAILRKGKSSIIYLVYISGVFMGPAINQKYIESVNES